MTPTPWKPVDPFRELDEHLENAYKRVAGVLGFKMGQDRLNLDALSGTARNILDIGTDRSEPFFMRVGQSLGAAVSYRPKDELSLKELAAEVLEEFHREALGAYQELRVRLRDQAGAWLNGRAAEPERCQALLAAADGAWLPPAKEEMFRSAQAYVAERVSPGTLAICGGFAGFGLVIATLRHPVLAAIGAVGGAAILYYLARRRNRAKAQALLTRLPQELYNCLRRGLSANVSRYEEIINR